MSSQEEKKSAAVLEAEDLAERIAEMCLPHDAVVVLAALLMYLVILLEQLLKVKVPPLPRRVEEDLTRLKAEASRGAHGCLTGLQSRGPNVRN